MSQLYRQVIRKRRDQVVAELQHHKFFSIINSRAPLESSVFDAMRKRSAKFRNYAAFQQSIQNALLAHATQNDFLHWFTALTDDCRVLTVKGERKEALWHIFLAISRRIPATPTVLDCLATIEKSDDYTLAAYTLFNTFDYQPLINDDDG